MTATALLGVVDISSLSLFFVKVCAVALIMVVIRGILWLLHMMVIRPFIDPLQNIPGPNATFFQSHIRQVLDPNLSYRTNADWTKLFGLNIRIQGFGKHDYRLMTFDARSMSHVLSSAVYEKPWQTRAYIGRLVGRGIFSMEGAEHRMQRKIMAPAFTYQSIKNMAPVFFKKAEEVCKRWKDIIGPDVKIEEVKVEDGAPSPVQSSAVRIDVAQWITRASFDVMGLAGFNYDFHALQDESEEVYAAYRRMFKIADKGLNLWNVFELHFPILRKIFVNEDIRVTNQSLKIIARSGTNIVSQKKAEYLEAQEHGVENKDLLTLLIKSNLSSEPSKRLTDQELLDQCSTMLLAGSDTLAMALSWCIYLISQHPEVQKCLRQEISKVSSVDGYHSDASGDSGFEDCTACNQHELATTDWARSCSCSKKRMEAIEGLPYLDNVVRESLRFCPPVHSTIRVATRDDNIPIAHPVTLKNGETVGMDLNGFIKIKKGSYVHIPIEGMSYSQDIWGSDALEFKPERWKEIRDRDPSKPGINNLMAFGYGPHSCLGYKWAIAEMKIFLVTLLSTFEFLPAEGVPITKLNSFLTRPWVKGEWSAGSQLPIMVRELK